MARFNAAGVLFAGAGMALLAPGAGAQMRFEDVTRKVGLDGIDAARVCFADVNGDGRADAVVDRQRVFLHTLDGEADLGWRFVEVDEPGLPDPSGGAVCVFADVDNDGHLDAVFAPNLDAASEGYEPPERGPKGACWLEGNGDGTFGDPVGQWRRIEAATPATTASVAAGDVNRDGLLDLWIGNWYRRYGASLAGHPSDLLIQEASEAAASGTGSASERSWRRVTLPQDRAEADSAGGDDLGPRPTYGAVIAELVGTPASPELIELNYGRRWNRVLVRDRETETGWRDAAPALGLDGDEIRHGRYPQWLKERAREDPRFEREDEAPFRANGNTFDCAVGDIDNDGDFDLFLAEITHGWAGESSDRSRFMVQRQRDGQVEFVSPERLSVDRVPEDPTIRSWNQGDLYAELADLDHDGRLDLILCSSDYPDNQRLRVWRQQADGTFADVTPWIGVDHIGAQQPSLADLDGDGDLDLMVGQSFNRLSRSQQAGRSPRVRVYLNKTAERDLGNALVLRLTGDPALGANRDALGAIVRVTAEIRGEMVTQSRQLVGLGGHQGKQRDFIVHVGLGGAERAERVEVRWPTAQEAHQTTVLEDVAAGTHEVRMEGD